MLFRSIYKYQFSKNGVLQILENVTKAGYTPHEVTKVLMSHLHKDHAGGITYTDAQTGEHFISFPYATYFVQRREYDYAMGVGSASYITKDFELLDEFSKVIWLHEDAGTIDGYIRYELTQAHSQYHQVFWIEEDGATIFFGGDEAPQLQQMRSRFIAKYDKDGKKAMEWRQKWWELGKKESWQFAFYHDLGHPTYLPSING